MKTQRISSGEKIVEPVATTKEGYILDGWYYGGEKWSFNTDTATTDMTLVAAWVKNS